MVDSDLTIPPRLLRDGLLSSAKRTPDKVALVIEGVEYTYSQLMQAALKMASQLVQSGIQRGDRVAIYMDNTWPCVVSIYAVLIAGGVFLVINPQTKSDKLEFVLKDSDAKVLCTDSHLAGVFADVVVNSQVTTVICSGDTSELTLSCLLDFNQILASNAPLEKPVFVVPNDMAALIYTSGSTGVPKGVMHTHQSMVFAAWSLIEYLRLSREDKILLVLPVAFDYGLYQLFMALKLGGTLVIERSFTFPVQVYKRIEEQKVTVFPGVPTIFAMMVSAHKKKPLCFPTVTRITNTAAALPEEFVSYLQEIFPNALIYKMYGLTECKRVSYLEPELVNAKSNSVGKAIPGTEVYLLSEKTGQAVSAGETGVLYVRGPHIMLGYWKQDELSRKMLKPGRYPGERVLCTHDLFRMDSEGYLYFVGRNDDIIKTRGEKVSPVEVENALYEIKGIKEAAVIGAPDELLGESVKAFVTLEADSDLTDKKIKKICLSKLENFMVPKDIIVVPDSLPKTANGKIDKKALS
ncbi:MAG: acyl--CoA ligase [Gammaproteobacteria bacterium]|nr:acyl--CoA ligase [Gammaproteobacteria bacterium]